MDRLQKKCLIASGGMHLFLMVLLLVGSAFVPQPKTPQKLPMIRVVPTIMVEGLVAGGGGDPTLPITNDKQKGDTLDIKKAAPPAPPPTPKPVAKKPDPVKRVETPKPAPVTPKQPAKLDDDIIKHLKPVTAKEEARRKAEAEEEQRKADEAQRKADARRAEARENALREKLAKEFGKAGEGLRAGFKDGTSVKIGGPGGEAYAGYELWVKEVYDNAWVMPPELFDEDSTATVSVTIARTGEVLRSKIVRRSRVSVLDRSVQRALDSVTFIRPFPEGATDQERTFTINFNLKAKNGTG